MSQVSYLRRIVSIQPPHQLVYQRQRGVLQLFFTIMSSMSIMNGLLISNAIFGTLLYIETRRMYNHKARANFTTDQHKRKIIDIETESEEKEYEVLYILGHNYKGKPNKRKRAKHFLVQWWGYSPENGGLSLIPEKDLIPNASALLNSYKDFCRIHGNPYMNPYKTKMVKEYLAPSVTGYSNPKHQISKKGSIISGVNTSLTQNKFIDLEKSLSYSDKMGFICSYHSIYGESIFFNKNQLELLTWFNLCSNWSFKDFTVITHPLGVNGINYNKTKSDQNILKNYYSNISEYLPYPSKRYKFLLNQYWNFAKPLIVLMFASGRIAQSKHALVCVIQRDNQGFTLHYFDPWIKSSQPIPDLLRNTKKNFKYSTTCSFISFGNQTGMDRSCFKRAMLIISQLIDGRKIETFGPWHQI